MTYTRCGGHGREGSLKSSPASPIDIISYEARRPLGEAIAQLLPADIDRPASCGIFGQNAGDGLPGEANPAARAVPRRDDERMHGMIGRANITPRRAD